MLGSPTPTPTAREVAAVQSDDLGNLELNSVEGQKVLVNGNDLLQMVLDLQERMRGYEAVVGLDGEGKWSSCKEAKDTLGNRAQTFHKLRFGYNVLCEQQLDGGGWTLVAVSSDDGQDTWTWDNRTLWTTDKRVFGSLGNLALDFKSSALHDVAFRDLLFVHAPSGVWAAYHNVTTDNSTALDRFIEQTSAAAQQRWCPAAKTKPAGYPLSAGTLALFPESLLCNDTTLYITPPDFDGSLDSCNGTNHVGNSFGPTWNAARPRTGFGRDHGCPFDDPGYSASLGPCRVEPLVPSPNDPGTGEYCLPDPMGAFHTPAIGFGAALELNTAPAGSGGNNMRVYVR